MLCFTVLLHFLCCHGYRHSGLNISRQFAFVKGSVHSGFQLRLCATPSTSSAARLFRQTHTHTDIVHLIQVKFPLRLGDLLRVCASGVFKCPCKVASLLCDAIPDILKLRLCADLSIFLGCRCCSLNFLLRPNTTHLESESERALLAACNHFLFYFFIFYKMFAI